MTKTEKIVAKVARIIDNRTVAISAGSTQGVKHGTEFAIISQIPGEVKDPDTNEVLGTVKIEKLRVKVFQVEEKYCLAETFEYSVVNEGGNFSPALNLTKMLEPPKLVKHYKTFDIDESQKREIKEEKSVIKVGDIAEEVQPSDSPS